MFGNFVNGAGRVVDLVGALSVPALLAVFVVGVVICYLLPESMASSYAVLFFSAISGVRVFAGTDSLLWTIPAFLVASVVFAFFSFVGNVRRGTTQEQQFAYSPRRSDPAALGLSKPSQRIHSQETFCRSCGASVEQGSRFCVECGTQIGA